MEKSFGLGSVEIFKGSAETKPWPKPLGSAETETESKGSVVHYKFFLFCQYFLQSCMTYQCNVVALDLFSAKYSFLILFIAINKLISSCYMIIRTLHDYWNLPNWSSYTIIKGCTIIRQVRVSSLYKLPKISVS